MLASSERKPAIVRHRIERAPVAVGFLKVEKRRPGGRWELHAQGHNLVVTQAESLMAQMAIGAASSALSYIELGDPGPPATPPVLADTTLEQTTAVRKSLSTLTASGNVVTAETTFLTGEGNGFTYTEAGLFTGVLGSGTMFARKTFAGITKTSSFELKFTWFITFLVQTTGGECTGISLIGPSTVSALTFAVAAGGEASVAATFDFAVGANNVDFFLNGVRMIPGTNYVEAAAGALVGPVLGPAGNKGVNLTAFTLLPADEAFLIHRSLA